MTLAQNLQQHFARLERSRAKYYNEKQRQAMRMLLALDKRIEASPYFLPRLLVLLVALLIYLRGRPLIAYLVARWSLRAARRKSHSFARRARIPRNAAPSRKARLEESRRKPLSNSPPRFPHPKFPRQSHNSPSFTNPPASATTPPASSKCLRSSALSATLSAPNTRHLDEMAALGFARNGSRNHCWSFSLPSNSARPRIP